jgi:hypothetical protein
MSVRKPTKTGSLTPAFIQAAARDPEGALSQMFLAAFGVTLVSLMSIAKRMMEAKDVSLIIMALTAGVQIRNHVVFVGRDYGNIRTAYPELIIEGDREQRDIFNFGALHALGHVFAHVTSHDLGSRVISKAGSCVTGEKLLETEAGKINREIFESWTVEDKGAWPAWLTAVQVAHRRMLDPVVASIPGRAQAFTAELAGGRPAGAPVPPRPAPPTAAAAAPVT